MENEKTISSTELVKFVNSLKTIVKEQLEEGFNFEIKGYNDFLESSNLAFSDYYTAFKDYRESKNSATFLFNNIQLHRQLKDALEANFDRNEVMYFAQSFQNLNWQALDIFSSLHHNKDNEFYQFILKTEEEQFTRKPYLIRQFSKLPSKIGGSNSKNRDSSIHSFLYFFFQQSVSTVLEENKEKLFDFYQQLAEFAEDFWEAYENNTAFVCKLHDVDYNIELLDAADLVWKLDDFPEKKLNEIKKAFGDFCNKISSDIEEKILNFNFSSFQDQKKKFLVLDELKSDIQKDVQKSEKSNALWRTTRFAFTEDRSLNLEIYLLKYQIVQKKLDFIRAIDTVFNEPFYKDLQNFELQFDRILDNLNNDISKKFKNNPHDTLNKFKLQLKKELIVKSLPQIRDHLNSSEIIKEIDDFETMVKNSFTLSQNRLLMKSPDFKRKVNSKELESILPNDLISFEIKPTFIKVFPAFKREVIEHIQNVLNEIETAPYVTLFSIESASQHFRENKNSDEVLTICIEGVNRSKAKLQEIKAKNQDFFGEEIEKFRMVIENIVGSVIEITNNESAFQIKIRIVKAKALSHSKELKDKVISKALSLLPTLIEYFKNAQSFVSVSIQKFTKHFALEKPKGFIATDISDYLTDTQSTIAKLPYIYQRLFSFEPLESFELYIERKGIMDKLELAFSRWKEEKFAPVAIIGEKGSGKTTFINKFLNTHASNENVFKFDLLAINKNPAELYKHILEQTNLLEPVPGEKKIVVLDGFERLYEAKINGFEFLLKLFKTISDTQKDVFWIVAAHSVSWNIFDKSIDASNYFGYHIYMNNLDFDELNKLIESRHKLSGYSLLFAERQKKKSILGSKSIDLDEQQKLLRKDYFNELNKNVQGNILQTFIYWMRSASLLENKTIQIESGYSVDFNFVRNIRADKLILLKNILIHNGLDVTRLAKISRMEIAQMELHVQQLIDDGILTDSGGVFFITPVIYKQIIKHMQNINLLH